MFVLIFLSCHTGLTQLAPTNSGPLQLLFSDIGGSVEFNVNATGTPPLFYQWRLNGVKILGATGTNLVINDVQNNNFGNYSVYITNDYGAISPLVGELGFAGAGGGTVVLLNYFGTNHSRVYGVETSNPSLALTGNTAADIPPGTQTYTGSLLEGSNFVAQLWSAKDAEQPEAMLLASGILTTFRTGAAAGVVAQRTATLMNVPGDYPVATLQLRAWDSRGGTISNWAQVLANPSVPRGLSERFNVLDIGGVWNGPSLYLPVKSFNLFVATNHGASLESARARDSGFTFYVNDQPGKIYEIQCRTNLVDAWYYLATVTNLYGKIQFKDAEATNHSTRFYRALRLP